MISALLATSRSWVKAQTDQVQPSWRDVLAILAVVAVVGGYAWWATSLRPFTFAALVATAAGALAAMAVGTGLRSRAAADPSSRPRAGAAVWWVLLGCLAAWELAAYLQLPRSEHPTLSSLANGVLRHHPARAAAMAVWLVLGVRIVKR